MSADLIKLAQAAWHSGNLAPVLPQLEDALRTSHDPRLWQVHGLILRRLDRRAEAIESLQRAVSLQPANGQYWRELARTQVEAGLPGLDAYRRALQLTPGSPELVMEMANAGVNEGQASAAIDGLADILGRSPEWTDGHALLCKLRWMQGEREGFDRSFDEAIAAHPRLLDLRREQLLALLHAEQWDKLMHCIADGRAHFSDQSVFDANEGIAHAEMGNSELADRLLQPFADTREAALQVRRVRHLIRSARWDEAGQLLDAWLDQPDGFLFWPYATLVWRVIDPERWQWLEGDDRFFGVYDIADRLPPLDALADTLRGLHRHSGQPLDQSLRGGTQTSGELLTRIDPLIVHLREAIRATVEEHVAGLPERDPRHPLLGPRRAPINFSGSWSVRLGKGGFHANHVHPAGWISSALYIVLPPDLGREEAGFLTLGDPRAPEFQVDMPPFRTVEPRPGRLVLFPSYTFHGTRPFGAGERLTVAFDVAKII